MSLGQALNVFGRPLRECCISPIPKIFRIGSDNKQFADARKHLVCVQVTENFLAYSKLQGNDLTQPMPYFKFPGLKHGDFWCLSVLKWREALEARKAPFVLLEATHITVLQHVSLDQLLPFDLNISLLLQHQKTLDIEDY